MPRDNLYFARTSAAASVGRLEKLAKEVRDAKKQLDDARYILDQNKSNASMLLSDEDIANLTGGL